jgi:gamma-glutamylcyclotransferase (GGCT)/AIG2-like uncharacterized protein YtfP
MANKVYQLFVYGSLRKGFKSPAYEYISRYFTFAGDGRVRGQLYDMGEYPAGVPGTGDHFIYGELYSIKDEAEFPWAFGQLDDYEGITAEPGEIALYQRELTDVLINDRVVPAWIYWYKGDVEGRPVISSGDLIDYLKNK